MFTSPKIYTSWLSKLCVLLIDSEKCSRKSDLSGGLYTMPNKIGFDLGRSMSKNMFSYWWEKFSLILKEMLFLMQHATPPPFLFLSHLSKLYPFISISSSRIVSSSLVSESPITAALVFWAKSRISSIFGRALFMFKWIKCIPRFLKHS